MLVARVVLFCLVYLALPFFQIVDYLLAQPFLDGPDAVNYAASILAYDWLVASLIFTVRLPWLQKLWPHDSRVRLHILSSLALGILMIWHATYYFFINVKLINLNTWILLAVLTILGLAAVYWVAAPGFSRLRLAIIGRRRAPSYDWLKRFHHLAFIAIGISVYIHILDAKIIGVAGPLSSLAYQILPAVALVLYTISLGRRLLLPGLLVGSVTDRGGYIELGLKARGSWRFNPGQFAFVRLIGGAGGRFSSAHPFSLIGLPGGNSARLAVKAIGETSAQVGSLQPGQRLQVDAGYGAFRPSGRRPLALIGAGIGSGPIVSLLHDLAARQPTIDLRLLLVGASRRHLVEAESLPQLLEALPNAQVTTLLSDQGQRYNAATLAAVLSTPLDRGRQTVADRDYFICAPPALRRQLIADLKSLGVRRRRIHYEAFSFDSN